MHFYRGFVFAVFILLTSITYSFSQEGELYLENYKHPFDNLDNQNLAVLQDKKGVMYFANTKGVLTYNGTRWTLIHTQNTPYALGMNPKNGKLYVGCRNNFGYIKSDKKGTKHYVKLSDKFSALKNKKLGDLRQIKIINNFLYFYSDKALIKFNLTTEKLAKVWWSSEEKQFAGFLFLGKQLYIHLYSQGLFHVDNDNFTFVEGSKMYAYLDVLDFASYSKNKVVFTANNGWGYFFDGKKIWVYTPVAYKYLNNSIPNILLNLPENQLAIGTLSGGCMIVGKDYGKTKFLINYQNLLPDDEILALGHDRQGGLWICHNAGITRVDLDLPLRNYSTYSGLDGNITSLVEFQDTLFVASSIGLFYLSEVEEFAEIEAFIRRESKYLQRVEKITRERIIKDRTPKQNVRIYRHPAIADEKIPERIVKENETLEIELVPTKVVSTERSKSFFENNEAREIYALNSMQYVFKEVTSINARCKQLVPFQNTLLVASNLGLFELQKSEKILQTNLILADQYIHFIYVSQSQKNKVFVGTDNGFWILEKVEGTWKKQDFSKEISESIYSILESDGKIWLGSKAKVFWANVDEEKSIDVQSTQSYEFIDSYSQEVPIRKIEGKITCFLNDAAYVFDNQKFVRNKKLSKKYNGNAKIFYKQPQYTWNYKGIWQVFEGKTVFAPTKLAFLEMFKDIEEIYIDKKQNIWFIDQNQVYKLDNKAQLDTEKQFDIFIQNVRDKNNKLLSLENLVIDYNDNTLSFSFQLASPFYIDEEDIEYQYWLEKLGVRKQKPDWSAWNKQALVSFPFLPKGRYKLHVRAKNVFSQNSFEKTFEFEIKPPFWETWAYFLLELGILVVLLSLSYIFSRNRSNKTSWISRVLTIVTLITMFEFLFLKVEPYIESAANGIPLAKLGMNIVLALSLYPIERVLKFLLQPRTKTKVSTSKKMTGPKKAKFDDRSESKK